MKARLSRPAALCLAAALLGCGGAEERKAEHLAKAIGFFDAQNQEKAAVEFKNVLQIDPKSAKPYYYLGRIEEGKQNWPQAFGFYQKAVELDPNDQDARFKLAQFFALARDPAKAEQTLAPLVQAKPRDLDVRMIQVAIATAKGESEAALKALQAIVGEQPAKPDPYLVLAALQAQKSRPAEAEAALKAGLAANPGTPSLLGSLAKLYEQQRQWDRAEATERELIAADPKQLQFRAMLAETQLRQGHRGEVEQTLRTALKDFPDNPQPALLLAEFFARQNDPAKAEGELRAAIAANPKPIELHSALANLLERVRQPEQAAKVYRDFIAADETRPEAVKARVQLAELLARQGQAAESERLVDGVLADNPQDHAAWMLKGKLALGRKNAQDAIAAFRSVLKEQPDSTEAMSLLAGAFQLDGKPALVQENLEKAVQAKPQEFALRRNLVQFLVQQNNPSLALEQANDFLKLQPDSLDGLNLKADVLTVSQQAGALEPLLKDIKAKFPDQPVGAFRLGAFYQAQKNHGAAEAEYEAALQKAPNDYDILKALTSAYLETKQPAKAEARLKQAQALDPKQAGVYQLLGLVALSQGQEGEGVKALEKASELNPKWLSPQMELSAYFGRRGDWERAVAAARKVVEAAPDDWSARATLANLLEKARQPTQAEQVYRDFIARHKGQPEAVKARGQLAEFLARAGRADESKSLVDTALANNPQDHEALLRKARLALADKQPQDAIPPLQAILKDQPDAVDALVLLATAQQLSGQPDQGRDSLEKAVRARPGDFGLRKSLIQRLVQRQDLPAAFAQADDFLAAQPASFDGLNLKADLLAMDKQDAPLESLLKDIKAKFPDHPQAAFRLGSFYQSRGKLDLALAEYDIALQKSKNAYEPLKAMASAYLEMKQPAKAEARLRKVLAENPKHGGAHQLLAALAFAQNRGEEGVKAANKAIELDPNWLPSYAALAGHYERQGQPARAIEVYQRAQAAVPGDVAIGFGLARAYEGAKQFDQAMAQYESILKVQPDNLLAVNNLASLLSATPGRTPELPRALALAKRLEGSEEPAFLDTLAWIHCLAGDPAKALPLQIKALEKAPQVPVFQYHLGMIYARQGDPARAKEHLAKALETKTEFPGMDEARAALEGLR
ncbi:tetratricopeptide repeat protein [Methylomagnum sp.]